MRGVTEQVFQRDLLVDISTRTPHAGSDSALSFAKSVSLNFNPHSPCGE